MELARAAIRSPLFMVLLVFAMAVMVPQVAARRIIVGGNVGWSPGLNYTQWAAKQHFYFGDWLFFVYDRNQIDVLEVNQTEYETCNAVHPIHNWTTGAGRDVVPLNETKRRYFLTGKGQCYNGMKFSVKPQKPPAPPKASPVKSTASSILTSYRSHFVLPVAFAIGAVWDSFLRVI